MRTYHDLVHPQDALPMLKEWLEQASNDVRFLRVDPLSGQRALEALQVTTRSPLGAIAYHTGGLLVASGWIRVLGAGCLELSRAIDTWNGLAGVRRHPPGLLVGDDVLGGFFSWDEVTRTIHYLAPETCEWEDQGISYTDWLWWLFTGNIEQYYQHALWEQWRADAAALTADQGFMFYPPLFADAVDRTRSPVPVEALWTFQMRSAAFLQNVPPGSAFVVRVVDDTDGSADT